jgi:SAM-dependent methyltransferase
MHYKIGSDITIKTENAAKPESQRSAYLDALISGLNTVSCSFDYGCGKLRYKDIILRKTETLTLIDSEVQISREQMICGQFTTIRKIAQRSNHLSAYSIEEFACLSETFDRGFCINVLSVIPYYFVRRQVLSLIRSKLRPGGTCLFVVQYRNSDFTRMRGMANARPWRDGFLIDSLRGFSFYGLILPERLVEMVAGAGFEIAERRLNEGSVYLLARAPKR